MKIDIRKDYYDILAVSKTASVDVIKKKYRELAKVYHPDANNDMDAETREYNEKKFKDIEEAKEVLCDEQLRKEYDEKRFNNQPEYSSTKKRNYNSNSSDNNDSTFDELFFDAGALVINENMASIGLLQRRFRIGFNRAARIMDLLISEHVVTKTSYSYVPIMNMEAFNAKYNTHYQSNSDNNSRGNSYNYSNNNSNYGGQYQSNSGRDEYIKNQTSNDIVPDCNSIHNGNGVGVLWQLFNDHKKFTILVIVGILLSISSLNSNLYRCKNIGNLYYSNQSKTTNTNKNSNANSNTNANQNNISNNTSQTNANNQQYQQKSVLQGWVQEGNNFRYYVNGNPMVNSWIDSNNSLYYLNAVGLMERSNWVQYNGNFFYVNEEGKMQKNKWIGEYYVGADGAMLKNAMTPDGYWVGADGKYVPVSSQTNNQTNNTSLGNTNSVSNEDLYIKSKKKVTDTYDYEDDTCKISISQPVYGGEYEDEVSAINDYTEDLVSEMMDGIIEWIDELAEVPKSVTVSNVDITSKSSDKMKTTFEGKATFKDGTTRIIKYRIAFDRDNGDAELEKMY